MLQPEKRDWLRLPGLLGGVLILLVCVQAPSAVVLQTAQTESQSGPIKDGIGVGEILIGESSAADVEARYGKKYELRNNNDYSYRMDYANLGLAFYYCFKDTKKKIFLVELHHGVTSKHIVVGESTLKDVLAVYGERTGGDADIYEYKGIQFYFEARSKTEGQDKPLDLDRKVIEVDIVPPDKSSNFCD